MHADATHKQAYGTCTHIYMICVAWFSTLVMSAYRILISYIYSMSFVFRKKSQPCYSIYLLSITCRWCTKLCHTWHTYLILHGWC